MQRFTRLMVSILLALISTGTALAESVKDFVARYDKEVVRILTESGAPGAAIVIVENDEVVYLRCYGIRQVGRDEKVDPHTAFRIASVSKGFASVLTGILVDEGRLSWDKPIVDYVPDFVLADSAATRSLTVRHVLSHTTGLPPHTYDNLLDRNVPMRVIKEELKTVAPSYDPGTYSYQNVIYSLIGDAIMTATGYPYQHHLRQRILEPLGMQDASISSQGLKMTENRAWPHVRWRKRWVPTSVTEGYDDALPAAGVNASITDMGQWLRALMGGMPGVIPPRVFEEVSRPVVITRSERRKYNWRGRLRSAYYGMGWRVFNYSGNTLVFHGGGLRGYRSQVAISPKHNVGIAILVNAQSDYKLLPTFLEMYFGYR